MTLYCPRWFLNFQSKDLLNTSESQLLDDIKAGKEIESKRIKEVTHLVILLSKASDMSSEMANKLYKYKKLPSINGHSYIWYLEFKKLVETNLMNRTLLVKDLINLICEYILPISQFKFYPNARFMIKDGDDWCEMECIEVISDRVKIHYIGWKDTYDQVFSQKYLLYRIQIINNDLFQPQNKFYYSHSIDNIVLNLFTIQNNNSPIYCTDSCDKICKVIIKDFKFIYETPYVLLHYVGWHDKYDEWLCLWSNRIKLPEEFSKKELTIT